MTAEGPWRGSTWVTLDLQLLPLCAQFKTSITMCSRGPGDSDVQVQLHKDVSGTSIGDTNLSAALSQSLGWKLQADVLWLSFICHSWMDLGLVRGGSSVGCTTGHCDMEHFTVTGLL